ncbi:MAG: phosphate acyltransferase PlsX [Candidatus Marinimicrobia bacterium]|jgi:glycerol-3-phosphate acyltransferase PlsX|nr:phosphate acyltransferase PlsX [Candidatus Neomarinimicrobiota bacterium]MBT3496746.1 phosphate acyltransferase PlsX [Candidatus Neomarinimicrobiota bacterium]MBT3692726.1 phosphate acyltransferase PlsX [Candidatus Neomarinimicrobiota bacterium]MBT4177228.1 phosphate acyltransferase PlsX [Candidatus Neomarinimicrobiota bacterium]MBT4593602.1 phosphate acyltransferase PlsX [Candidatus Neomarinimicrobiota bacterium]
MMIAVDAMGGDHAPDIVIQGAIQALETSKIQVMLLGDEISIQSHLGNYSSDRLTIQDAPDLISMDEPGSRVVKTKPNSSIVQGLQLVKDGKADAFVSAGNTGAVLATSLLLLGRIPGVHRPALAAYIPSESGGKIICDVGANPDTKPKYLLQFAILASHYYSHVEGVENPKVGLINIGSEANKGSALYQETHQLLQKNLPNFVGNIEGRYLMSSEADVLICDGFVGNTLIKFAENWISHLGDELKSAFQNHWLSRMGKHFIKPALVSIKEKFDYEEHGGAPLLGINGVSIVAHGSSGPKSIKNSIKLAQKCVESHLIEHTQTQFKNSIRGIA